MIMFKGTKVKRALSLRAKLFGDGATPGDLQRLKLDPLIPQKMSTLLNEIKARKNALSIPRRKSMTTIKRSRNIIHWRSN